MIVGFRVDANEIIATGHLMRCLSIAEQIRKQGGSCLFFLAEDKCTDILIDKGFEYIVLGTKWDDLEYELDILPGYIIQRELGWLIIDSYKITKRYCESLNRIVKTLVVDAKDDEAYDVSAILNYSHLDEADKLRKLYEGRDTLLLLGLKYAPLREEFFPENQIYEVENRILITTGGTDPYHVAYEMTCRLLSDTRFSEYNFIVVLGRLCTDADIISNLNKDRVTVLQGVSNMSELMQRSMVAFTAGGSTSIELCACKTPTVCFSFADNQIGFSKMLGDNEIISYIGDIRDGMDRIIEESTNEIGRYLSDSVYRNKMIANMESVCDGVGARRIAQKLLTQK